MLVGLVGVTGVGKTHLVDKVCSMLEFKKISTIRTRPPRPGENPKLFMSHEQLDAMYQKGVIVYKHYAFGGEYGYLKDEVLSNDNYIVEIHWPQIYDWKKVKPDMKTIYILPNNLDTAKEHLKNRHLPMDKEIERLNDIDENYNTFKRDKSFASQFDYVFCNNYDEESENNFVKLISSIIK